MPDKSIISVRQSETMKSFNNHVVFVFRQSNLNTVSSTVYQSSFELCMLLAFIPYPIFLFPVICFELQLTRTPFEFPWSFELSGVDCNKETSPVTPQGEFLDYAVLQNRWRDLLMFSFGPVRATKLVLKYSLKRFIVT